MKLSYIHVKNYKGFRDSGRIELDPHWNVIVGRNNAGKSALIEGFRIFDFTYKPHTGLYLARGQTPPPQSYVDYGLSVQGDELERMVLGFGNTFLPLPEEFREDPSTFVTQRFAPGAVTTFERRLARSENRRTDGSGPRPSHGLPGDYSNGLAAVVRPSDDRQTFDVFMEGNTTDNGGEVVFNSASSHIYVFNAKRFGKGSCESNPQTTLTPDAANLAAVLATLNVNPARFEEFNRHVRTIFPSIYAVTAAPGGEGQEVRVWPIPTESQRDDLTLPLDECGTGVGQVLSILYVAINQMPGTIVIDEPGSFLHPGAAKALINILRTYDQHQYVVSTHSPDLIASLPGARVFSVSTTEGVSSVQAIDPADLAAQRSILEEVGVAPGDIFAADRVLWVEGPTERDCFHRIYEARFGRRPVNFTIVPMRATGDFERKGHDARAILDIYLGISRGGTLLPPTVGFSFDRERRTESEVADLKRSLDGLVDILPRMMIENYFLNAHAIQHLVALRGLQALPLERISALLVEALGEPKVVPRSVRRDLTDPTCLVAVDGARVLKFVLQQATYEYRKVQDGPELLSYLMANAPQEVQELVDFAWSVMARGEQDT